MVPELWKRGDVEPVMTEAVLSEYEDVLCRLAARYPGVDPDPIVGLVAKQAILVRAARSSHAVCSEPDDDKFIAGAIGGQAKIIVSGDKRLLDISGHKGVHVLKPADFAAEFGTGC